MNRNVYYKREGIFSRAFGAVSKATMVIALTGMIAAPERTANGFRFIADKLDHVESKTDLQKYEELINRITKKEGEKKLYVQKEVSIEDLSIYITDKDPQAEIREVIFRVPISEDYVKWFKKHKDNSFVNGLNKFFFQEDMVITGDAKLWFGYDTQTIEPFIDNKNMTMTYIIPEEKLLEINVNHVLNDLDQGEGTGLFSEIDDEEQDYRRNLGKDIFVEDVKERFENTKNGVYITENSLLTISGIPGTAIGEIAEKQKKEKIVREQLAKAIIKSRNNIIGNLKRKYQVVSYFAHKGHEISQYKQKFIYTYDLKKLKIKEIKLNAKVKWEPEILRELYKAGIKVKFIQEKTK